MDLFIQILGLAFLYVLTGKAGQYFSLVGGSVSLIWLPSGIALTAILIFGKRVWSGIFLGVIWANLHNNLPIFTMIGMGIGSSLGAILGGFFLEKVRFNISLTRTYDIFLLIFFGSIIDPIISSLIDIPSLFYGGAIPPDQLSEFWIQFILGDALGVLLMTPNLLILSQYASRDNFLFKPSKALEYFSILLLLCLLCFKIFSQSHLSLISLPNIPIFVIFIFVVWLSLRFGHLGTSITILMVSLFSLWGTSRQLGPFINPKSTLIMFNLWFFIVSISLVGFVITVVIFELTESQDKAQKMAMIDDLTQLYNRRHFNTIFPQFYQHNCSQKLAFFLIDIDHFKKYNDTYGHQQGDLVLAKMGQILKQHFQDYGDFSFRLGGEEFAAFMLVNSTQEAFLIAENLRIEVENLRIEHATNSPLKWVTVSIGLKVTDLNKDHPHQEQIYQQADQALYQAKATGRNCICVYSNSP